MNKNKLLIPAGAAVLLSAALLYFYYGVLYKDSRDIHAEQPAYTVSASALMDEYEKDAKSADSKYLNQTIEVTGDVNEVHDSIVILGAGVLCNFDKKIAQDISDTKAIIKGRCIGYDELFGEVKLDQCTIKNYKP